jgi:hypothetical protein
MIDVLNSLKKDLLGRRLLPFVVLAVVLLAGGVAYAVLGGGSSSSSTVAAVAPALPPAPTTVATPAPTNPKVAVSETTSGAGYQRGGATRDPFVALPQPKSKTVAPSSPTSTSSSSSPSTGTSTGGSSGSSGSSPSSGGGSGASGGSTPTGPSSPSPAPVKPKKQTVYRVALLFGPAPPPGQNPQLTAYTNLSRKTQLPSKQDPLLVLGAVGPGGKGAIFALVQPAILKGPASCIPSASQCEAIDLPVGQTEELSYVDAGGQTIAYQLQIVSITKAGEATTARTASAANRLLAHVAATHHRRGVPRSGADLHRRGPAGGPSAKR